VAKSLGARVLVTVSSEGKGALCRDAGADEVILYTQVDFASEVQRLTAGRGLAVVYDAVGKTTFDMSLLSLKSRGTLVLYGSASGRYALRSGSGSPKKALYLTRPLLGAYTATRSELLTRATGILNAVMKAACELEWNAPIRWLRLLRLIAIWRVARRPANFCWFRERVR